MEKSRLETLKFTYKNKEKKLKELTSNQTNFVFNKEIKTLILEMESLKTEIESIEAAEGGN